jgi:hypothetical protein
MKVGHQHGGRLNVGIDHVVLIIVDVCELCRVDGRGGLRGPSFGSLVARPALLLAGQGRAAIFGVHSAVVSQEQIATHKSRSALQALKWPFLGICAGRMVSILVG